MLANASSNSCQGSTARNQGWLLSDFAGGGTLFPDSLAAQLNDDATFPHTSSLVLTVTAVDQELDSQWNPIRVVIFTGQTGRVGSPRAEASCQRPRAGWGPTPVT